MYRDERIPELERDGVIEKTGKFEATDTPVSVFALLSHFALETFTGARRNRTSNY